MSDDPRYRNSWTAGPDYAGAPNLPTSTRVGPAAAAQPSVYQPGPPSSAYGPASGGSDMPTPHAYQPYAVPGYGMPPPQPSSATSHDFDVRSGPPSSGYNTGMPGYGMPGGHVRPGAVPGPGGPAPGAPGAAMMMNPWTMISGISNMGQQIRGSTNYVEDRVNWFTGGFFGALFQVDPPYVWKKLLLLLLPFLRKYDYMRQTNNIAGNVPVMKPPRADLYAPDLYLPLMSFATYVVTLGCNKFANGHFTPDVMYNMFAWATSAWVFNFGVMYAITKMMGMHAQPPWLDVVAFSGYAFVGYCLSTVCGWTFGRGLGWHLAWLYTSTCMAIFLIRSYKQMIRLDAAQRGFPAGRNVSYLLLALAGLQYLLSWVMGATVHGHALQAAVTPPATGTS